MSKKVYDKTLTLPLAGASPLRLITYEHPFETSRPVELVEVPELFRAGANYRIEIVERDDGTLEGKVVPVQ